MTHDVVVVGAGPAGLACARDLAGRGLSVRVVGGMLLGGELLNVPVLEGTGEGGAERAGTLMGAATGAGAVLDVTTAESLAPAAGGWRVVTSDGTAHAAARVVFAAGCAAAVPEPGERLAGHGVSTCAMCDGPLFAGRDVAVLGGDRWATSEATFLAGFAGAVTLLVPGDAPPAPDGLPNLTVVAGAELRAVHGDHAVESIDYVGPDGERALPVAALFAATGRRPATDLLRGLAELDTDGRVTGIDRPGLVAAGTVRAGVPDTVDAAIADGRRAAADIVA